MRLDPAGAFTFDGEPIIGKPLPRVVVQDGLALTLEQQAALKSHYRLFAAAARAAGVPYLVQHITLPDSTAIRFVSNMGQDTAYVRPAPAPVQQEESLMPTLYCVPADTTNQYGYTTPLTSSGTPLNGGKGTAATALTASAAAVRNTFKYTASDDHIAMAHRFARAQTVIPSGLNKLLQDTSSSAYSAYATQSYAPSRYSSVLDIGKEWISPDRKTVVTCTDGHVRVNGADKGNPGGTLMWACIMAPTGSAKVLMAVSESGLTPTIQFYTRPLHGSASVAWTAGPSVATSSIDPGAIHKDIAYTRKGSRNASGDKCLIWAQCPFPYVRIPDVDSPPAGIGKFTTFQDIDRRGWAWALEYDVNAGTVTTTAATREQVTATFSGGVWTSSASGSRQIDCGYVGDTKVFTTLDVTVPAVVEGSQASCSIDLTRGSFTIPLVRYTAGGGAYQNDALLHYDNDSFVVWKRSMTVGGGGTQSAQHSSIVAFTNGSTTPITLKGDTDVSGVAALCPQGFGTSASTGTSWSGDGNGYGPWPILNNIAQDVRNRVFLIQPGETTLLPNPYPRAWRPSLSGANSDSWLNYRALDDFYVYSIPTITFQQASGEGWGIVMNGPMGALGWGWMPTFDNTTFTTVCSDADLLAGFDIDATQGLLKFLRFL